MSVIWPDWIKTVLYSKHKLFYGNIKLDIVRNTMLFSSNTKITYLNILNLFYWQF